MNEIEDEIHLLVEKYKISEVKLKDQPTNWIKPYGNITQFSLYNTTGDTSDFSTDLKLSSKSKFFFDPNFKNIYNIFKLFQNQIVNFRLNCMGKNSGLAPHKVNTMHGKKFRCRFHLPVITNDSAWVMLDWKKFWLKRGFIYFFNNGCVHSAGNDGQRERYHLVFDCILDEELFDKILNVNSSYNLIPQLVSKISKEENNDLLDSEEVKVTDYEIELTGIQSRFNRRLKKMIFNS